MLFTQLFTGGPIATSVAYAATLATPAKTTTTLKSFLKQAAKTASVQSSQVQKNYVPLRPATSTATQALPSAEPATMKVLTTPLTSSSLVAAATTTATSAAPLDLKGSDGRLELLVPRGALDLSHATINGKASPVGALSLKITQVHGHVVGQSVLLSDYQFQVVDSQGHVVSGAHLRQPATILYHYQPGELEGLNLNPDKITLSWPSLLSQASAAKQSTTGLSTLMTNNAKTLTLSASVSVLSSVAAVSGDPSIQAPPTPHLASVSGDSGQLSYTYPLSVPPGPNGFAPTLQLNYSSQALNERHSNTSPGSPVGDGWSFGLGSISAEKYPSSSAGGSKTWYSLNDVGGVSDRLTPGSTSNTYVTQHVSYLKITYSNSCFHVWDRSGTYYELGCTSDSLQYANSSNGKLNYRWDVNRIVAPFESTKQVKTILISYLQDKNTTSAGYTSIRDAAVKQITYGVADSLSASSINVLVDGTIDFHYLAPKSDGTWADKYGTNQNCSKTPPKDTTLRCDDPLDRGSVLAPDVMSTLTLDTITSYIGTDANNNTTSFPAYSYSFTYQNHPFLGTTDPISGNDIYASGDHLLRSVTPTVYQKGTAIKRQPLELHYTLSALANSYYDGTNIGSSNLYTHWYYLDNYQDLQTGSGGTVTYQTAYNNTNGTPNNSNGDTRYDPLYCSNNTDCTGKYAHPNELAWTTQVVTSLTTQGADSSGTSSATTTYGYDLAVTGSGCPSAGSNTDCVSDVWAPISGTSKDGDWQDYYHSEFRGFAAVYITSPAYNLTVDHYYTTSGRFTLASKSTNYNAGELYEKDIYQGLQESDTTLLERVSTTYAGQGPHNACRADLDDTFDPCEILPVTTRTTFYEETGTSNTNAPWVQTDYTYDDYSSTSGLSTSTTVYHNLLQEVISSSNASTITKKWQYALTDETDSGVTYYHVDLASRSEIDDSSGHVWQCTKTFYDEGRPSGVPAPAAGWPTTQFTYSDCSNQTLTELKSYTGYDLYGNAVATVDNFGVANASIYTGGKGCPLSTAPAYMVSGWTAGRYTTCTTYDHYQAQPASALNALAQSNSTTYDYGQTGLQISATNVNGQTTNLSYSYDSSGNRTIDQTLPGETGTFTNQSGEKTQCTESSTGPCYEIDSVSSLYANAVKRTFYDAQGRAVETRTPLDVTHDTITFTVYNDSADSVFQSLSFRVASGSSWLDPGTATDDSGNTPGGTATYKDLLGRTVEVVDPLGNTQTIYYGLGTVSGDSNTYQVATSVDANSHVQASYTDALNNEKEASPDGKDTPANEKTPRVRYAIAYNSTDTGSTVLSTLPATTQTATQYNVLNKPASVIVTDLAPQSGQTITSVITTATYDDMGRIISLSDPDRGTHTYTYDADGRQLTDTSGSRTIGTSYDLLGRAICVQDAVPTTDGSGNCSSGSHPLVQSTYDVSKLAISSSTDFPVGQLSQSIATTSYADGSSATTTEQFQHDQRGQVTGETLQLSLPSSWNVTTTLPTYQVTQSYNDANQQTTTQTTVGGQPGYTTTQAYDSITGQLTGLSNNSTGVANLATLAFNSQAQVSDINFQTTTGSALANLHLSYDGDLRPAASTATWQSGSGSNGTIFSQSVSYDAMGNVISKAINHASVSGQSTSGGGATENFCYDEQDRLIWAGNSGTQPATGNGTCGSGTLGNTLGGNSYSASYVYTNVGQIWQEPLGGAGTEQQVLYCDSTHPHQLTGVYPIGTTCANLANANYSASYDAWGNLTSRTYNGSTATLSYDALDHLTQWNAGSTNQGWYVYDASGQRVLQRSVTSSTSLTVYAFDLEEHVYDGSGNHQSDTYYYTLNKHLIGTLTSSGTQFSVTDALGSVLSTFSAVAGSAIILGNQVYTPYGTKGYSAGSMGTSKGFTGQYEDPTGLDYYNARYYDPVLGQFITTDIKQGNPQGMDPYAYVAGNPETKNDPTGYDPLPPDPWLICALLCGPWLIAGAFFATAILIWSAPPSSGQPSYSGGPKPEPAPTPGVGSAAMQDMEGPDPQPATSGAGAFCSFTANTDVTTEHGKQPIGTLHSGDKVLAYNPHTQQMELEPITHVWVHQDNDLVDLALTTTTLSVHGQEKRTTEVLHTTQEHPFLTREKGFLPANQLVAGMHIVRADGTVGIVTSWKIVPGKTTMYNLTVANDHTFTVGEEQWVVHNVCGPRVHHLDVGPYNNTNRDPGLQLHHGIMDAWAKNNIAGYNGRTAPTVALTTVEHYATFGVYNRWRAAQGAGFVWTAVSWRQIYTLSEQMFNAAGVPASVRTEYYRQFSTKYGTRYSP